MTRRDEPLRYASRRSGIVALVAVVIFFAALLQAGVLQNLFRSELELRVILPESGLSGLSVGAEVNVLGTLAGRVEKIVLDPDASFYAVTRIDKSVEPFVRSDSAVFIRKQFGIAGAAYLEISRGRGAPLDWDYAVLTAREEAEPTASVGELIADVRKKVLPLVDDTRRAIVATAQLAESLNDPNGSLQTTLASLSVVSARIADGKGNVGRLLSDDSLMDELESTVAELQQTMSSVSVVVANLEATTREVAGMTAGFGAQSRKLPEMIDNTNATLQSLHTVVAEVGRTMPEVTDLMRNSATASNALPTLLAQTQQTLAELERLLVQLQGSWLLRGGGDGQPIRVDRLSPIEARP
jgi:phospholipid/cholesterol/gamma-HCH transport system substrate-binding protein